MQLLDTEQERLEEMDKYGIEKLFISTSSPVIEVSPGYGQK